MSNYDINFPDTLNGTPNLEDTSTSDKCHIACITSGKVQKAKLLIHGKLFHKY